MSITGRLIKIIINGFSGSRDAQASPDRMLEKFDQEINNLDRLILPAPESKPRTSFTGNVPWEKKSIANLKCDELLSLLPVMLPLRLAMKRSAQLYEEQFNPKRSTANRDLLVELENIAKAYGATELKYVRVPQNMIFEHKGIPHEYAIVFTVEMNQNKISTAPSFKAFKEVIKGYRKLARISNIVADFLRSNGYAAYPGVAVGGLTDYTALGEKAGLGAIGYHGLLITPDEGARLRINTIYTNITNLPIETKNEHLWIRDYCAICGRCIRQCPPRAIFNQPHPRGDGGMQCISHSSCREFFHQNFGCGICVAVCPFSKAGYNKIKIALKRFYEKKKKKN